MLRLAICDDTEEDTRFLSALIKEMCSGKELDYDFDVSFFTCGEDLENYYEEGNYPFDIIFLDVYMTGQTGIETARKIRRYDGRCKIIFTTVSPNYALEGYSVFAYNYLVKPINPQLLAPVFKKAAEETYTEKKKSLCVKAENRVRIIPYKDIKYIESEGKIVRIFTGYNDKTACYLKLDEIEEMLADPRFLRSHKSFLVNMDYVTSVEGYFFILTDNIKVPIRQKSLSDIKKRYYEFILKKLD